MNMIKIHLMEISNDNKNRVDKDQANQNPRRDEVDDLQAPPLTEELLAVGTYYRKEYRHFL